MTKDRNELGYLILSLIINVICLLSTIIQPKEVNFVITGLIFSNVFLICSVYHNFNETKP